MTGPVFRCELTGKLYRLIGGTERELTDDEVAAVAEARLRERTAEFIRRLAEATPWAFWPEEFGAYPPGVNEPAGVSNLTDGDDLPLRALQYAKSELRFEGDFGGSASQALASLRDRRSVVDKAEMLSHFRHGSPHIPQRSE